MPGPGHRESFAASWVDASAQEVTHARGGPLEFSTSKWSSRRPYLQCLLRLDQLWEMGIDSKVTACQHETWRICQSQRPNIWPMQTEMRTSTTPMKSWSPGRTLLSTSCRQAITSSKAHALPAARRRPFPVPRNTGGRKLRNEDRDALRGVSAFHSAVQPAPEVRGQLNEQRATYGTPGAVRACGLLC